jgi:hypothetical protein
MQRLRFLLSAFIRELHARDATSNGLVRYRFNIRERAKSVRIAISISTPGNLQKQVLLAVPIAILRLAGVRWSFGMISKAASR